MNRPFVLSNSSMQDDLDRQRQAMVETQLGRRDITDSRVLSAMLLVPREEFVAPPYRQSAYHDCALPIAHGQTISQPYTVAFMCQAMQLDGSEKVLEVGTGSGYAAAVLSALAREIHTVERIPELAADARIRLDRLGCRNVQVHVDDGTLGLPEAAPFDAIVVTAGGDSLPEPYAKQLKDGGRVVIPLGSSTSQKMYRYTLRNGVLVGENLGRFSFVPLIGRYGRQT